MFLKDLIKEEWSGDHLGQCQNKRVNFDLSHDVVFSSCSSDYGSEGIFSENIQGRNRKTPNHKGQYRSMIMAYKDRKWCQKSKSWNVIVIIILKSEIHFCAKGGSGDSWWGLFQVPCVGVWLPRKGTC